MLSAEMFEDTKRCSQKP